MKILGILKYTDIASPPYVNTKGDFHLGSVQVIFEKIRAHAWNTNFEKIQWAHNSQRSLFGSGAIIPFGFPILGLIDPGSADH